MPGFNIPLADDGCPNPELVPIGRPNGTIETSRVNRYILTAFEPLGVPNNENILVIAHKCDRPSPEIDRIVVHHGQDEAYWPGKNRWNPIEITFYEGHLSENSDTTAKRIYEWWSAGVLNIASSRINSDFRKDCTLDMLNGKVGIVHSYHMYGCWPTEVSPTTMTYSESDIAQISFKLQMNKCKESPGVGGESSPDSPGPDNIPQEYDSTNDYNGTPGSGSPTIIPAAPPIPSVATTKGDGRPQAFPELQ